MTSNLTPAVARDIDVLDRVFRTVSCHQTLFHCCLVSKLWSKIAIPVLWNTVTLRTNIPDKNAFQSINMHQLSLLDDETVLSKMCNNLDADRVNHFRLLLEKETSPEKFVKIVKISLDFILEFQIGPLSYLEEIDLSSTVQQAAWDEFTNRMHLILEIINKLPRLCFLKIFVDVDLSSRSVVQQLELYNFLGRILEYPAEKQYSPRNFGISLSFGGKSDVSGDLALIWNVLSKNGGFVRDFKVYNFITRKIKAHAGLWLPSRLVHLFKVIGPLKSIHLCDGARITPQLVQEISDKSASSLECLYISSPDYVDDESLVIQLLSKCHNLKKLTIDGMYFLFNIRCNLYLVKNSIRRILCSTPMPQTCSTRHIKMSQAASPILQGHFVQMQISSNA